jgi:NADPH-dependent ferric siderophore reductase
VIVRLFSLSYINIHWLKVREFEVREFDTAATLLYVDIYQHRKTRDFVHS